MASNHIVIVSIDLCCSVFYCFILFSYFFGIRRTAASSRTVIALLLICSLLTFVDAGTWYYDGRPGAFAHSMVCISNFANYLIQYVLIGTVGLSLRSIIHYLGGRYAKHITGILHVLLFILVILTVVTQFNDFFYSIDDANRYVRGPGIGIAMGGGLLCLFIACVPSLYNLNRLKTANASFFMVFFFVIAVSIFIQLKLYGISASNIAITMGVVVLTSIQTRYQTKRFYEQKQLLEQQERDLQQARMLMMRAQIQPHFLFNSLAIIRSLCTENGPKAAEAIDYFSLFLRHSISILDSDKLIPFDEELKLIKSYLFMEEQRFPNAFDVEYDLEETDFQVPTLSLQPLVENCVKHGLRSREEHGLLYIGSWYDTDTEAITVVIRDNGCGFDTEARLSESSSGSGINNVSLRIARLTGGTLEVTSIPGSGTSYTISIPD